MNPREECHLGLLGVTFQHPISPSFSKVFKLFPSDTTDKLHSIWPTNQQPPSTTAEWSCRHKRPPADVLLRLNEPWEASPPCSPSVWLEECQMFNSSRRHTVVVLQVSDLFLLTVQQDEISSLKKQTLWGSIIQEENTIKSIKNSFLLLHYILCIIIQCRLCR